VGQGLTVLSKVFVITLVLVLGCLVVPAAIARRRGAGGSGGAVWDVAYVSCLGLGFLLIEVALIQKLALYLGQPTYTLAVVLSVLLLTSGAGAHLFPDRLASAGSRGLAWFLAFAVALAAGVGFSVGPVLEALLGTPPFVRALAAAVLIAPLGLVLGAPFPTGLTAVAGRAPDRVAWLWAVNSATSVLGSVVATIVSLHAGVTATFVAGLSAYSLAAVFSLPVARVPTGAE
jgi:hypothetical protein